MPVICPWVSFVVRPYFCTLRPSRLLMLSNAPSPFASPKIGVRYAVAVVRRCGVREVAGYGDAGDRGVDRVPAAREIDGLERRKRRDLVGRGRAAVVGPRLELWVADAGVVAVGEYVVVAQDVDVYAVRNARADRASGDRRMSDGKAHGRGALSRRRVAERDEHSRHLCGHGNAVQHRRQPDDAVPRQQNLEPHLAVRQQAHGGTDDARDAQQRLAAPLMHGDYGLNVLLPLIPADL